MALPARPSTRWTSYETWRYDGMDERLSRFMQSIDRSILVEHVREIAGGEDTEMSEPFSAGQYWCCFELFTPSGRLFIARVRLPRHPESSKSISDRSEIYSIECEVATMRFLQHNVKNVPFPRLYAYEGPGTARSGEVGASYMIIEGFYGNTLQDVEFDICRLSIEKQAHILKQWTRAQTELAQFTFPEIGSISSYSDGGEVIIGPLAVAATEDFANAGPFSNTYDYFLTVAQARLQEALRQKEEHDSEFCIVGPMIFKVIVETTAIFKADDGRGCFHLNHMDMGTQNILVDDDFNFLAIIDWEFAQSAPLEVNHFPMPFPLLSSDQEVGAILANPDHPAHRNMTRQTAAQKLYVEGFKNAENELAEGGRSLLNSISSVLTNPAARIFALSEKINVFQGMEEELTYEMIRLGLGLEGAKATEFVEEIRQRLQG